MLFYLDEKISSFFVIFLSNESGGISGGVSGLWEKGVATPYVFDKCRFEIDYLNGFG